MQSKRIKPLLVSLVLYFTGFVLYKTSNGSMILVIPGALFMLAGVIMNVIFVFKIFKDTFK